MGRTGHRRTERRRLGLALAAAVAVHALAVLLVWRAPPTPPAEPPTRLQVEIVEVTRPAPVAAPSTVTPPPQRPTERQHPKKQERPQESERLAQAAEPSKVAAENAPHEPPSLRPDLEKAPTGGGTGSGEGGIATAEPPSESKPIELFDPKAIGETHQKWQAKEGEGNGGGLGGLAWGGVGPNAGNGRGDGIGEGEGPEAERKRVSERIARDIEDVQAKSRVDAGLFDPYFAGLARGVKDGWKPHPTMIGAADDDSVFGRLENTLRTWQNVASTWGETGSPYPAGEKPETDFRAPELRSAGGMSGFDPGDFLTRWNRGEFGQPDAIVVVRLTQDRAGVPLRIDILQPSGFSELDASAMNTVRTVALDRDAPPAQGLGLGEDTIRTVWKFEAKVVAKVCGTILDPTGAGLMNAARGGSGLSQILGGQCGGTFDPALGVAEMDTPGETIVVTKVALVALYGGATAPSRILP